MIQVRDKDLAWMLLSTVRYSLGRRSTAPDMAYALLFQYGLEVDLTTLEKIHKEIVEEITRAERQGTYVGDKCDHETWKGILAGIESQLKERKSE